MPSTIIGSGGVNRTIKDIYIGDGGVNRKQKEIYLGNAGVNRKIYTGELFRANTVPFTFPSYFQMTNTQGATKMLVTIKGTGTTQEYDVDDSGKGADVTFGKVHLEIWLRDANSTATRQLFICTVYRNYNVVKDWLNYQTYIDNGGYFNAYIDERDKKTYTSQRAYDIAYGNPITFEIIFADGYCSCNGIKMNYNTGITKMYPYQCSWLTIDAFGNGSSTVVGSVTNLIVQ